MKQSITFYDFERAFVAHGRENQFSNDGLRVLYDWLEDLSDDTGTEYDLDVIALCCEFSEDTPEDIASNYSIDDDDLTMAEVVEEYLNDNTSVCGVTDAGTIVYQSF
jgi:hypothetical protein